MDDLHVAIATLAATHHSDRMLAAATAIRSCRDVLDLDRARSLLGSAADQASGDPFAGVIAASRKCGRWDPLWIAAAMEGATAAVAMAEERQSIEIAWTGPAPHRTALRRTEQVIRQVIDSATLRIWLVSYVVHEPHGIADALTAAISRGVIVNALLESPKSRGGTLERGDPAGSLASLVPGIRFYEWPSGADRGCVHAKCVIADGRIAFVTSANLTGAAMERNMELGVLIRGGSQPIAMDNHLRSLIEDGLISALQ